MSNYDTLLKSLIPDLSDEQLNQFRSYYQLLIEWSKVMNLTSLLDEKEVYIKHFYDSLLLVQTLPNNQSVIDIGTGAGFPGIPLKIVQPNLYITLLEPTLKKVTFLKEVVRVLNLQDVNIVPERAEVFVKTMRESFDIVTSRAVASLPMLLELSIPLLKVGGIMLAMKGANYEEELSQSTNALKVLGAKIESIETKELPEGMGKRSIIIIKKIKATHIKYPRGFSQIKNKTL